MKTSMILAALMAAGAPAARAQDDYPVRTVRMIVPFTPGAES